jgi:flavodoxin
MRRILVVYYSRTGYTRTLAGKIAEAVKADVETLDDGRDRRGLWGYLRCAREAINKRTIEIQPAAYGPSAYEVVVIGTPVWAGNISSPIRSYITSHQRQLNAVAFFCTQGGSGAQKVFRDMGQLCGKAPVACLAVNDTDIDRRAYDQDLLAFVDVIAGNSADDALSIAAVKRSATA